MMMKMLKKSLVSAVLLCLAVFLAACGGGKKADPAPASSSTVDSGTAGA
jgi:ABC-type oligopeptide transport system substrate-binding subunit